MNALITKIESGSLAEELELVAGDKILKINGKSPLDIIDLSFLLADEEIELLIEHYDGNKEIIAFEKDFDEELGAEFESAVFNGVRQCKNHCVFCFVDMIAPNLRKTLYIKDDDYRLSFLFGNFITLTNLTEKDFKRIKNYHLSPLFVSIHTMNPDLRAKMLRTPLAAKIQTQLDNLERAGAQYHTQIVLCRDLNDDLELTDFALSTVRKHLMRVHPEYVDAFDYLVKTSYFYCKNMFVTRRYIFNAYCEWFFSFYLDATREVLNSDVYKKSADKPERLMGWLAERIQTVWLMKNHLRIKELFIIEKFDIA